MFVQMIYVTAFLATQGKTGLKNAICQRLRSLFASPHAVLDITLRGVVARMSGGQTMAKALDIGVLDGSSRLEDGTPRTSTYVEAHNAITHARVLIGDEYEEWSGAKLQVCAHCTYHKVNYLIMH